MKTFIVFGCSRSGTSLVAGILHKSGIWMGSRFHDPVHQANPKGFYENLDFADFNIVLLQRAGGSYTDIPTDEAIDQAVKKHSFLDGLRVAIEGARRPYGWGIKDPRLTILWRWYEPLLVDLNPHVIITRRSPEAIARSWVAVKWVDDLETGVRLALDYDGRLDEIVMGLEYPFIEIGFDNWWTGFGRQSADLSEFVGRELDFGHFDEGLRRY